jgi:transposase-like protein
MEIEDAKRNAVARYRNDAVTLRQVALESGVSHETVRRWLIERGVKLRPPGHKDKNALPSDYTEKDVAAALMQGITTDAVARHLKVTRTLIRKIAKSQGLVEKHGAWCRG